MKITTEVWACDSCHALIGAVQGTPEPRRVQVTVRWLEGPEAKQEARDMGHMCARCWDGLRFSALGTVLPAD